MASYYAKISTTKLMLLFLTIVVSLQSFSVSSFEYHVGGSKGWVVPPANDTKVYNDWASENRFQIGDTVRFRYRKDSVMQVSEEDYKKCNSTHPTYFSNTGNTVYKLDHPGPFYFISGVSGHCEKGQRMIIKVMEPEDEYPSQHHGDSAPKKSAGSRSALVSFFGASSIALLQLLMLYTASSVLY
ncbi:hypothetical protein K2173_020925 [Erythroxylum novogranatense]|uniref:Phytocyanin domain-containing protein n=1 Tax=Erythroxylum novogranatense TaxID=1862640 RepID=A0AAV8TPR7_9ROSI|nr:hypothetical protein K2173_020925 [Erythroxylum novogranatense]